MTVVYRNCLQLSDCGFFIFGNGGLKKNNLQQVLMVSNQVYRSIICFYNLRNKTEFQFSVIKFISLSFGIDFYRR